MRTSRKQPNPSRLWSRIAPVAEREVAELLRRLPEPVRARVEAIPIVFDLLPSHAQVEAGLELDLMGVFLGNPYGDADPYPEPPGIFLFLENIWDEAEHDVMEYRRQVRDTLLHEIGHYLGLEEDDLVARDLE